MKLDSHLWRSRHGIYYIRFNPKSGEIKRSLNTRDPHIAKMLAYQYNAIANSMNPDDLIKKLQSGQTKQWKLKHSNDAIEIETDGTEEDHGRALEALKVLVQSMPGHTAQASTQAAPIDESMTIKRCADDYISERSGEISENSIRTYKSCFNKLLAALGPNTPIFDHSRYQSIEKPDAFWLPILGLLTGARINELCNLTLDDIKPNSIKFSKSKTVNGLREIPMHPKLIDLGFLDYVADVRALNINNQLFPHLVPGSKNGLSNLPGRDFSVMKKRLRLGDDKVFHSFRKTLISCLQFNQCPADI